MHILPDYLRPGLKIVFCGTAVAPKSAERKHYYCGKGNRFWEFLFAAGITSVLVHPENDAEIGSYGLGLTDLAKSIAASSDRGLKRHYDVGEFIERIERCRPLCIAFHGKAAAEQPARHLKVKGKIELGLQSWRLGSASVFVLPSASGANRDPKRLGGRPNREAWFEELALHCGISNVGSASADGKTAEDKTA